MTGGQAFREVFCFTGGEFDYDAWLITSSNFDLFVGGGSGGLSGTTTLNTNQWYWLAGRRHSGNTTSYIDGAQEATAASVVSSRTPDSDQIDLGNWRSGGEQLQGRVAAFRFWSADIGAAAIRNEYRNSWRALTRTNLYAEWPMLSGSRTLDTSGHGRALADVGTLTDGQGPPIPFPSSRRYWITPSLAAALQAAAETSSWSSPTPSLAAALQAAAETASWSSPTPSLAAALQVAAETSSWSAPTASSSLPSLIDAGAMSVSWSAPTATVDTAPLADAYILLTALVEDRPMSVWVTEYDD